MRMISIGFSRPKRWKPYAWLIMKLWNIPYDHVFIRLHSVSYDRDLIYQASSIKVNFMGPKIFLDENLVIAEFPIELTDENYIALMQFAIDKVGTPYGVLPAIGLGLVRIAELLGKKIKNPFKLNGKNYECVGLGAFAVYKFANESDFPKDIDDMSPKDLYDYLVKKMRPA